MKKIILILLLSFYCIPFKESSDDPSSTKGFLKHYLFYLSSINNLKEYVLASDTRYLYIIDSETDEIKRIFDFGSYPSIVNITKLDPNTNDIVYIKNDSANYQYLIEKINLVTSATEIYAIYPSGAGNQVNSLLYDEKNKLINVLFFNSTSNQIDLNVFSYTDKTLQFIFGPLQCPYGTNLDAGTLWGFTFSENQYFSGNISTTLKTFCSYNKNNLNFLYAEPSNFDYQYSVKNIFYNNFYNKIFLFGKNYYFSPYKIALELANPDGSIYYFYGDIINSNVGIEIQTTTWNPHSNEYITIVRKDENPGTYTYNYLFLYSTDSYNLVSSYFISGETQPVSFSSSKITKNKKLYTFFKNGDGTSCFIKVFSTEKDSNNNLPFLKDIFLPNTTNCSFLLELEVVETKEIF